MGISKSCDQMLYLMSPTTGPGKVEWSPCSRQNLKDFLQYGTAELRNTRSARKPTCLTMTSMRSAKKIDISEGNQPPGKKYNASMQCKFAMGNEFKPVLRKTEPPFHVILLIWRLFFIYTYTTKVVIHSWTCHFRTYVGCYTAAMVRTLCQPIRLWRARSATVTRSVSQAVLHKS